MQTFTHNLYQCLIALDQFIHCLLGTILGYKIYADETFSSYQYRRFLRGKTKIKNFLDFIFRLLFRQEEHCKKSYESERKDRHLPPEMRG